MLRLIALTILLPCSVIEAAGQPCSGWAERFPLSRPAPTALQVIVFDAARGQSIFFDGDPDPDIPATWRWNGGEWSLLEDVSGPDTNERHQAVFDSWRDVVVLYGGLTGNGFESDDTWEWNGVHWVERLVNPPGGVGRNLHAMAFDTHRGVTVLFGGVDDESNYLGDTWAWDGIDWTERTAEGPSPRVLPAMTFDEVRGVTVLHGGNFGMYETWEWDGTSWSLRSKLGPGRGGAAMVYDSSREVCVLFGGVAPDGGGLQNDMWEWDGEVWTLRETIEAPQRRSNHAMAYDSSRHAIVLFGGEGGLGPLDDTWEFLCPPACYPDLDGDGDLTLFDFLAFVNAFNAADPAADCDHSQSLDLFDFLCFTNSFNAGC
jgi:hypothetical protein